MIFSMEKSIANSLIEYLASDTSYTKSNYIDVYNRWVSSIQNIPSVSDAKIAFTIIKQFQNAEVDQNIISKCVMCITGGKRDA